MDDDEVEGQFSLSVDGRGGVGSDIESGGMGRGTCCTHTEERCGGVRGRKEGEDRVVGETEATEKYLLLSRDALL